MTCGCPRDALCDRCVADVFAQLSGVAACRGEFWAMRIAKRCPRSQPWPAHEGKAAQLARAKVRDLTSDVQLAELLAIEVSRWAARWWSHAPRT